MINANEIADLMGVSKATAYKIVRQLNAEPRSAQSFRRASTSLDWLH